MYIQLAEYLSTCAVKNGQAVHYQFAEKCCRGWRKQTGCLSGVFLNIRMPMICGKHLILMSSAKLSMFCFLSTKTSQQHTYILLNVQVSLSCLEDLANAICISVIS